MADVIRYSLCIKASGTYLEDTDLNIDRDTPTESQIRAALPCDCFLPLVPFHYKQVRVSNGGRKVEKSSHTGLFFVDG